MQIDFFCRTGDYHRAKGEACQDVIKYEETDRYGIAVAADGATSCGHAAEGADIACRAFVDFVLREQNHMFDFSEGKLAYLMLEHILYFLETETGERGSGLQNYASTIIGAVVDKKNGNSVLWNLGDGAIFRAGASSWEIGLQPKRFRGNPCLTTTKDAHKAVEVKKTEILVGEGFFLCTDGFLDVFKSRKGMGRVLQDFLGTYRADDLKARLQSSAVMDDCSYLAVFRDRN